MFPHIDININCKRTQYGWKVVHVSKSNINILFPLIRNRIPFLLNKENIWDKEKNNEDGFCFFPIKEDAIKINKIFSINSIIKRVLCKDVLATYKSNELCSGWLKVGICKKFKFVD